MRLFAGIAIGATSNLLQITLIEQTPSEVRGRTSLSLTAATFVGLILAVCLIWVFVPSLEGEY